MITNRISAGPSGLVLLLQYCDVCDDYVSCMTGPVVRGVVLGDGREVHCDNVIITGQCSPHSPHLPSLVMRVVIVYKNRVVHYKV